MAMLLCSAISSNAWSASACAPTCLCDGNVPSLPVPSPQGFVLYEVCNLTDIDDKHIDIKAAKEVAPNRFDMGTYSYRGMVTLSGTVTKADDGLGPVVHFRPEQAPRHLAKQKLSRLERFVLLEQITLRDDKKIGTKKLHLNTENDRWCAKATISLRKVRIFVADTEGEGAEALDYKVLRLGKYRKCDVQAITPDK